MDRGHAAAPGRAHAPGLREVVARVGCSESDSWDQTFSRWQVSGQVGNGCALFTVEGRGEFYLVIGCFRRRKMFFLDLVAMLLTLLHSQLPASYE